jgi:hypothetical protein
MIGEAEIKVEFSATDLNYDRQLVLDWIAASGRAVVAYYGRFPVQRLRLLIATAPGDEIHGKTYSRNAQATTEIYLGREVEPAVMSRNWVMTHEMVHLAFPEVPDAHHWIEEGIATYVEPIARAQTGELPVARVWRDLIRGLPQGLPQDGDRGLDHTPTWGRIYWGGALYCLLADIEIRQRTANRFGLQDALRGIVAAGADIEVFWPIARALEIADRAVGTPALTELYQRMKAAPALVDLDDLWRRLGVAERNGEVVFDDAAPLAEVRRAITAAR